MPDVDLMGCRTRPLMSYLKAMGAFRIVGEQADASARLWWARDGHAVLRSDLDREALAGFLAEDYAPSPITSPWSMGAGYVEASAHRDAVRTLAAVEESADARLAGLRTTIAEGRALLERLRIDLGVPDVDRVLKNGKDRLLVEWRASAPDDALPWLDASFALAENARPANPVLGSGGNDGRLDFSKNFLACLRDCLPACFGNADSDGLSRMLVLGALFGDHVALGRAPAGMFSPGNAGGMNDGDVRTNPWDVVLMFEGALMFGGGVARRLDSSAAVFPFTASGGAQMERGGGSLVPGADQGARGETWLPVWRRPASLASVARLMAEGRVQDDRVQARSGRAMSRAVATLGVDRGVTEFERVAYVQRNGLAYFAVAVDRPRVVSSAAVEAQRAADAWVDRIRRITASTVGRALARVDSESYRTARGAPDAPARWLLALADLELAVGRWMSAPGEHRGPRPLANLPAAVARLVDDGSAEVRLAAALASVGTKAREPNEDRTPAIRFVIEGIETDKDGRFSWRDGGEPGLLRRPYELLSRVARHAGRDDRDTGGARLRHVAALIDGVVDVERMAHLAFALSLCRPASPEDGAPQRHPRGIERLYATCYLAVRAAEVADEAGVPVRMGAGADVVTPLAAGSDHRALVLAATRLRTHGLRPLDGLSGCRAQPSRSRRVAAALAIPVHGGDRAALEAAVLIPATTEGAPA